MTTGIRTREAARARLPAALCVFLLSLSPGIITSAQGASPPRIDGPLVVHVSRYVRFQTRGFPLGVRLSIALTPHDFYGGNCCGIAIKGPLVRSASTAILFRWPRGYYRCSGRDCDLYAWESGERVVVTVSGGSAIPDVAQKTVVVR